MKHDEAVERLRALKRYAEEGVANLFAADAEALDTLLAELEPLGKTANGAPVYVGMEVWTWELKGLEHWKIVQIDDGSVRVIAGSGVVFTRLLTELFSTCEAVEKGNGK